jgi:two-component system chemotaxis response regulator CheB
MPDEQSAGSASGFTCPDCGGALWQSQSQGRDGDRPSAASADGRLSFTCRIGHHYQAAQLWIEHCAARNRALHTAARALAENAALARQLAGWTREHGNPAAAEALEREAKDEDRLFEQVRGMVDGLAAPSAEGQP